MSASSRVLDLLDLDALTDLSDAHGLDVPDGATDAGLRVLIDASEHATVHVVLAALPRETLKHACKMLSLPTDGRGRAALVRRLVEALVRSAESSARTLQIEVTPRQPRLAWNGMDQREAVTSVPSQVVEIVRPSRGRPRRACTPRTCATTLARSAPVEHHSPDRRGDR